MGGKRNFFRNRGSAEIPIFAFSFRLYVPTYTGDCCIVTRSSDSATQSIGFVAGVLDIASLETFCSGTDGYVTTWYNQGSSGVNCVLKTGTAGGKIVTSGTTDKLNGKPIIAVTDWQFEINDGTALTDLTGFYVGKLVNFRNQIQNNPSSGIFHYRVVNTGFSFRHGGGPIPAYTVTSSFTTQSIVGFVCASSTDCYCVHQGVDLGKSAIDFNASFGNIFHMSNVAGNYQELVYYNTAHVSDYVAMSTTINSYYGAY